MADESKVAPSAPPAQTPTATPDGAQPPPVVAPTVAAETQPPTTEDAIREIEGVDDFEALGRVLDESKKPRKPAEAAKPAEAPAPAPAAPETTDGAKPPPASAAPPTEPGDDEVIEGVTDGEKLPKNFRFHTEDPQRSRYLKLLRQRPEANPIDLAREAGYELPASERREAAAAPVAPQPAVDPLQPLKQEIDDLKKKKVEHRNAYEFDTVDEINEVILAKTLELQRKENEIEDEQSFQTEYRDVFSDARTEAVRMYPDTGKPGTPQFEEIVRERAYLEVHEPGFFDDPNYPIALVERLEKRRPELFKGAAATAAPTPPPPANTPAPAPVVTPPPNAKPANSARPVGAVEDGTSGASKPLSKDEAVKAIDDMSLEELEKLGDAVGTKAVNKGKKVPGVIRG